MTGRHPEEASTPRTPSRTISRMHNSCRRLITCTDSLSHCNVNCASIFIDLCIIYIGFCEKTYKTIGNTVLTAAVPLVPSK